VEWRMQRDGLPGLPSQTHIHERTGANMERTDARQIARVTMLYDVSLVCLTTL